MLAVQAYLRIQILTRQENISGWKIEVKVRWFHLPPIMEQVDHLTYLYDYPQLVQVQVEQKSFSCYCTVRLWLSKKND